MKVWILRRSDYEDQTVIGVFDNPETPARLRAEAKATVDANLAKLEAGNYAFSISGHSEAVDVEYAVIEEWDVQS